MALCAFLLVLAGLLLRSFVNLLDVDRGFGVERVLSVDLAVSGERYAGSQTLAFYRDLLETVRALPGVTAAGAVNILPLTSQAEGNVTPVYLESDTEQRIDGPIAQYRIVTQGYFAAIGIPLVAGRLFESQEPAPVILVTESLARGLWPGVPMASVVGRRVRIGEVTDDLVAVAGVVGDVRARVPRPRTHTGALRAPRPQSRAGDDPRDSDRPRTGDDRRGRPRRSAESAIAPSRSPCGPCATSCRRRSSRAGFQMVMVLLFAALALGLALIGVYGVDELRGGASNQRDRRPYRAGRPTPGPVAVGAGARVATGCGRPRLGLPAAVAAATATRSLLFGIAPLDPVALFATSAALLVTAAIACYVPARRAARVDAVVALRTE